MIDIGDMFDIETKYDYNYDTSLGVKYKNLTFIDGATLRQVNNTLFEIVAANKVIGELEID